MRKIIIFINNLIYKFKCITRAIFYIGSSDALPPPLTRDEEDRKCKNNIDRKKFKIGCIYCQEI